MNERMRELGREITLRRREIGQLRTMPPQTDEICDVMNRLIGLMERNIDTTYALLGKLYYAHTTGEAMALNE